jgi:hypothetical protein
MEDNKRYLGVNKSIILKWMSEEYDLDLESAGSG